MRNHKKILTVITVVVLALACSRDQEPVPCSWYIDQANIYQALGDSLYKQMGDSAYQVLRSRGSTQRNFVDYYWDLAAKNRGLYLECKY